MSSNALLIAVLWMVVNVMGMQIKKEHYAVKHDSVEMKPKAIALQTQFNSTDTSKFFDGLSNYVTCGGSYTGTNVGAPNVVGNTAGDVLYDLHLGSERRIVLDSCGSSFDTYIRVFAGSINGGQVCSCDDCGPCGLRTVLECTLSAGAYVVVVEGYSSREGNIALTVNCNTCAQNACHEVCDWASWWCPWGICDRVCNTVCDGACLVWNQFVN